jgi:hypothetical protein
MKQFKIIDVIISLVLLLVMVIDIFWNSVIGRRNIFSALGYWLFLIGAWHIISMVLHIVRKWKTNFLQLRKIYYGCTILISIAFFLPAFIDKLQDSYTTPPILFAVMALFYTSLCFYEVIIIYKTTKNEKV